jgi:hypothetical protein
VRGISNERYTALGSCHAIARASLMSHSKLIMVLKLRANVLSYEAKAFQISRFRICNSEKLLIRVVLACRLFRDSRALLNRGSLSGRYQANINNATNKFSLFTHASGIFVYVSKEPRFFCNSSTHHNNFSEQSSIRTAMSLGLLLSSVTGLTIAQNIITSLYIPGAVISSPSLTAPAVSLGGSIIGSVGAASFPPIANANILQEGTVTTYVLQNEDDSPFGTLIEGPETAVLSMIFNPDTDSSLCAFPSFSLQVD